jgi:O-antigen/teichoic acid export membrane protein
MSRSRRFLGGLSFGYLNQASVMLVGLWLTRFVLAHIGQHGYGLWVSGTQLLSYLLLMDFGIVALLPREVAYATGRATGEILHSELVQITGQSARIVLLQTPVVALGALLLWLSASARWPELKQPLLWVMLVFVAFFPLRIFAATLEGLQDLAFLGSVQFCAWALNVLATVFFLSRGWGLNALAAGWVVLQTVQTASCLIRLRARFPEALPSSLPRLARQEIVTFFRRGFWLSVAQIAQTLLGGSDVLLIGILIDPSLAAVYALTAKLVSVLANQPQLLMNAASPAISQLKATGDYPRLLIVSICLMRVAMTVSGLVACIVLAVNDRFVALWVGPGKFGGLTLTGLLVAAMLLRHLNLTAVVSLICYGQEKRVSLTTLSDGIVTIVSSLAAIKLWGLAGAPIGSIVGVSLVSLPVNFTRLSREAHVPAGVILKSLVPWFWRFALAAIIAQLFRETHLLDTLPGFFLASAIIAAIYMALLLPLFFRAPLDQYTRPLLSKLRARFRLALSPAGAR